MAGRGIQLYERCLSSFRYGRLLQRRRGAVSALAYAAEDDPQRRFSLPALYLSALFLMTPDALELPPLPDALREEVSLLEKKGWQEEDLSAAQAGTWLRLARQYRYGPQDNCRAAVGLALRFEEKVDHPLNSYEPEALARELGAAWPFVG